MTKEMQGIIDSNTDEDGSHTHHNQRYFGMNQTHEPQTEKETEGDGYQDIQQLLETAESI